MSQAISTIEELEQSHIALTNEAISELDYKVVHDDLKKTCDELRKSQHLLAVLQAERNTLSQVVRILASNGQIDPVRETSELEMVKGMYE